MSSSPARITSGVQTTFSPEHRRAGRRTATTRTSTSPRSRFAPSDAAANTYAYGGGTGALRITSQGGGTTAAGTAVDWTNHRPSRTCFPIATSPTSSSRRAMRTCFTSLFSGFDENTAGAPGHVFRTRDALAASPTWENISPRSISRSTPYHRSGASASDLCRDRPRCLGGLPKQRWYRYLDPLGPRARNAECRRLSTRSCKRTPAGSLPSPMAAVPSLPIFSRRTTMSKRRASSLALRSHRGHEHQRHPGERRARHLPGTPRTDSSPSGSSGRRRSAAWSSLTPSTVTSTPTSRFTNWFGLERPRSPCHRER